MEATRDVALADISHEPLTMVRDRLDEATVAHYAEILDEMPPIDLFQLPDGRTVCASGHHRIAAARRLGRDTIRALIHEGTIIGAADFAASSNTRHGRPLTAQERRNAVIGFLARHGADWTEQRIADAAGVSQPMVHEMRAALKVERAVGGIITRDNERALKPTHFREIARAPEEQWEPLATAAAERDWTSEETHEAVQNLKDERLPQAHKMDLLAGEADPVRVRPDGQIAAMRDTVDRDLEKTRRTSAFLAYRHALSALSNLALYDPDEIVAGLEPYDFERALDPHSGLDRYAALLTDLRRRVLAARAHLEVVR